MRVNEFKNSFGYLKERCYKNSKNDLFICFETEEISMIRDWKIRRKQLLTDVPTIHTYKEFYVDS